MVNEEKRFDAKMPLECGDCGTQWDEHFSVPMRVEVFIKKGKALACPKCGSKKVDMLPKGDFYVPDKSVEFKHGPERIRDQQVR
jgi:DNA-directed RNA polymerase subunit RPC12/RpoP